MHHGQGRVKLIDCAVHGAGSGAELFVVEGESAAASVAAVRSARFQAVLPLQGKPMNAWRASADKVRAHALYQQFAQAMGMADATSLLQADAAVMAALRFERVVLLMDPDADGIHIGALTLLYLHRWAPALLEAGRVDMARAPMFVLEPLGSGQGQPSALAYNPKQSQTLQSQMALAHGVPPSVQAVRGLGSLAPQRLAALCVDPATRTNTTVTANDVRAVVDVFGALG